MGLTCGGMVREGDRVMQGWMADGSGYNANHPECRRGGPLDGNETLLDSWAERLGDE